MKELQNFVDGFGLGISVEKLASKAYNEMSKMVHEVWIVNDRYLAVDGHEYQFIKSRKNNRWIVKEF